MSEKFLKINLTEGSKDISNVFVENVKNKRLQELLRSLKTEIANFSVERRPNKKKKMLDRINVVVDRMCKNLKIPDVENFETNPIILSIVKMLQEVDLAFEVVNEQKIVVECSLITAEAVA
jgi:hypothetical protein